MVIVLMNVDRGAEATKQGRSYVKNENVTADLLTLTPREMPRQLHTTFVKCSQGNMPFLYLRNVTRPIEHLPELEISSKQLSSASNLHNPFTIQNYNTIKILQGLRPISNSNDCTVQSSNSSLTICMIRVSVARLSCW